jgi:hypothetical protein
MFKKIICASQIWTFLGRIPVNTILKEIKKTYWIKRSCFDETLCLLLADQLSQKF